MLVPPSGSLRRGARVEPRSAVDAQGRLTHTAWPEGRPLKKCRSRSGDRHRDRERDRDRDRGRDRERERGRHGDRHRDHGRMRDSEGRGRHGDSDRAHSEERRSRSRSCEDRNGGGLAGPLVPAAAVEPTLDLPPKRAVFEVSKDGKVGGPPVFV